MSNTELQELFFNSIARIDQLCEKYKSGERLTRADCIELQKCNARLHVVGKELLLLTGSDDPQLDLFRQPHINQRLPVFSTEVH